jgi:hypothetical protein
MIDFCSYKLYPERVMYPDLNLSRHFHPYHLPNQAPEAIQVTKREAPGKN